MKHATCCCLWFKCFDVKLNCLGERQNWPHPYTESRNCADESPVLKPGGVSINKGYSIWQLLSIKENICPERPRKSHALQDAKKYFFLYITRKMRSTAFQPCITLGGLHWDEMGQKHDFLKKNALKTAFLGDTILDRLTSEGVGSPKKIKNATFLMLSFNDGP